MRRKPLIAIGLEILALGLAFLQSLGGVRTDEAKYLLDIPYPHPPLARGVFHAFEFLPFQDIFLRVVLATLVVQAVWLVWDMGRGLGNNDRVVLAAGWLLSSAVLLQAGSVMIAPVTALGALLVLWLSFRIAQKDIGSLSEDVAYALLGLAWLCCVMSSYQAVLFLPLLIPVLWRSPLSFLEKCMIVLGPVVILALYTLANPLAAATLVIHQTEGTGLSLSHRLADFLRLWTRGGSVAIGVVGMIGMLQSRRVALLASFALVSLYVLGVAYPFYAILFAPLFVEGLREHLLRKHKLDARVLLAIFAVFAAAIVATSVPEMTPGPAEATLDMLQPQMRPGTELAIFGPFGHGWQYESEAPVRRYLPSELDNVGAIVCLVACEPIPSENEWKRIDGTPVESWIRR